MDQRDNARPTCRAVSAEHPLGLDPFGSDLLTQLIYGARQSLVIGVVSTMLGLLGGVLLGGLAGAFGSKVDSVVMRVVDVLLSIPGLLLAVSVAAVMGRHPLSIMVAIAAAQVPIFARLLRGSMMAESRKDYVLACRSLGLRRRTITMGHVLPNSLGPVLVQATLTLATAIIEVAALSYLGPWRAGPGGRRVGSDAGQGTGPAAVRATPDPLARPVHRDHRTRIHPAG